MSEAPFPRTLTHARLRRAQGDTRGAIAILEALIDAGEESEDLVEIYLALGGDTHRRHIEPETAIRIRRLQRWLERVRREDPRP